VNSEAPRGKASGLQPGEALRILTRLTEGTPLDLRLVGRTLLHAAAVGVVAGLIGAAFFAGLEYGQHLLLERAVGLPVLRAVGESIVAGGAVSAFDPVVAIALPALGGLGSGLLSWRFAPETAGGGGDATIDAYHRGGVIRARVVPVKALASILALSSGGSGGREGPTMQIGAAIGAAVGRILPTSRAERRILVVAGVAAGISAVFRTPLGAALLATEMLYRDDFEAEALVPSILASVISYSVVIAFFGETTLFGRLPRFPFTPSHLPAYFLLALVIALAAIAFERSIRAVQRGLPAAGVPRWASPAIGGLLMGCVACALALAMEARYGAPARAFGVYGGGYGVLQVVISGEQWLGEGWWLVALLVAVALAKIAASALTIGSGGSAGDFAPSLVVGGLVGAAFAHAARSVFDDATIQPAAFALVGMGTFYGGLAHAPLSALVLVAELAGSYDLLVPMMLAIGVAYVALRRHSLYPAQPASRAEVALRSEPRAAVPAALSRTARELAFAAELPAFDERATLEEISKVAASAERQVVVAVKGRAGFTGLVELGMVAGIAAPERQWLRAHDALVRFTGVAGDMPFIDVARVLERCGASQLPVMDGDAIVGWIGDRELRRAIAAEVR
jgi:CIC family chloride channel protein